MSKGNVPKTISTLLHPGRTGSNSTSSLVLWPGSGLAHAVTHGILPASRQQVVAASQLRTEVT